MQQYIAKRLLLFIPVWIGISLLTFAIIRMVPGDVVMMRLAEMGRATPQQLAEIRAELGLDKPVWLQYVTWLWNASHMDLGRSLWRDTPVLQEIMVRVPVSIELAVLATLASCAIAIPVGVISAIRQDSWSDYVLRFLSILLISVPAFWTGTLLIVFPAIWFHWTPPLGYAPIHQDPSRNLQQFLLPALALGAAMSGSVMRMTRSSLLEVLRQDYIRTAWSKGLQERGVIVRHALKNAMVPVITMMGNQFAMLIGGLLVIIEFIFSLPGVGRLMLDSIYQRDYTVLQGTVLFGATVFLTINLLVDALYGWLDPRIRYH